MSGNWIGKIVAGVIAIVAVVGMKFYQKSQSHDEVKTELVQLCEGDSACLQAVETHFDACHEQAFQLGGRRQSAQLNAQSLVTCINTRAGQPLFSAD